VVTEARRDSSDVEGLSAGSFGGHLMIRGFFVWLHRWVGILMAGFLIVVGLTGSLLAFYGELNHLLAPEI
jgi:hypothetical protein